MAAGGEPVITNEQTNNGIYSATLLNARGVEIFDAPDQITQQLNGIPSLGGNFQYSEDWDFWVVKEWRNANLKVSVSKLSTQTGTTVTDRYKISIQGGNQDVINTVKSILSGEGAPAGAARRRNRKSRKSKKVSRRRRSTRRRL